jgi:hypothetical protein
MAEESKSSVCLYGSFSDDIEELQAQRLYSSGADATKKCDSNDWVSSWGRRSFLLVQRNQYFPVPLLLPGNLGVQS